jgi:hypothetical protein
VAGVAALALPLHHVETTSWAALARERGTDLAALALELKALAAVALAGIMLASRAAFARAWQLRGSIQECRHMGNETKKGIVSTGC